MSKLNHETVYLFFSMKKKLLLLVIPTTKSIAKDQRSLRDVRKKSNNYCNWFAFDYKVTETFDHVDIELEFS